MFYNKLPASFASGDLLQSLAGQLVECNGSGVCIAIKRKNLTFADAKNQLPVRIWRNNCTGAK